MITMVIIDSYIFILNMLHKQNIMSNYGNGFYSVYVLAIG